MQSEIVLQDLPQGSTINCIVDHPGFNPVCLQKWSLKMAAWQYKTKEKKDTSELEVMIGMLKIVLTL